MQKGIAILGSTGSIGTQALEVIAANNDMFSVEILTAYNNAELLVKQSLVAVPNTVIIGNPLKYEFVRDQLKHLPIKVFTGMESINEVVQFESVDTVLTAMVGYAGLSPTLSAVKAGKTIALANKETMVVAGELVNRLAAKHNARIIPVDSEHSAIFQCLMGESHAGIEKVILTASGGPFRSKSIDYLSSVKKEEALKHPNWCMGDKITIDSASMMNKGLEAIEARWLFHLSPEQIEIVIHPQSIVHSMVQFIDGSVKAQLSVPDMKMPIQFALSYPSRIPSEFKRLDFSQCINLSFETPDTKKFRNLAISLEAMKKGGNWPCIMNAANEVVVDAFLNDRIGFLKMPEIIEQVLVKSSFIKNPEYEDYCGSDAEARQIANMLIN
jgi:1-deoxy-D-xylulose-5-phosphate reductoisomerase